MWWTTCPSSCWVRCVVLCCMHCAAPCTASTVSCAAGTHAAEHVCWLHWLRYGRRCCGRAGCRFSRASPCVAINVPATSPPRRAGPARCAAVQGCAGEGYHPTGQPTVASAHVSSCLPDLRDISVGRAELQLRCGCRASAPAAASVNSAQLPILQVPIFDILRKFDGAMVNEDIKSGERHRRAGLGAWLEAACVGAAASALGVSAVGRSPSALLRLLTAAACPLLARWQAAGVSASPACRASSWCTCDAS